MRRLLTAVGLLAAALGIAFAVAPGLAAGVGASQVLVTLVGAFALVQGVRALQARRRGELQQLDPPTPEESTAIPVPGDDLDERIARLRSVRRSASERAEVRNRLTETAVAALMRRENCSRETAVERVTAGTWTDDSRAAAFLGDETVPAPPWRVTALDVLVPGSRFQRRARHTIDAIVALAEVES